MIFRYVDIADDDDDDDDDSYSSRIPRKMVYPNSRCPKLPSKHLQASFLLNSSLGAEQDQPDAGLQVLWVDWVQKSSSIAFIGNV